MDVGGAAERLSLTLRSHISSMLTGSIWAIAELLITLFALFHFFRDRHPALRFLRSLVPLSEVETEEVFRRVADTIHATVYGTLVVALVQGLLGGLMFWVLGFPAALLWGAAMALLAMVPVLGAFFVWAPAALFLALTDRWGKAVILTGWGVGVVSLIDNLLYPLLVGRRLRLHTLPVFIAIVGGILAKGVGRGDPRPRCARRDGRPRRDLAPPHRGGPRGGDWGERIGLSAPVSGIASA